MLVRYFRGKGHDALGRGDGQEALRMVSGGEDVETARQALALGAADYVTKPVDPPRLDSVLEGRLPMDRFGSEAT